MGKFTVETAVKVDGQYLDMEDVVNALNEQEETIKILSGQVAEYEKEEESADVRALREIIEGKDARIASLAKQRSIIRVMASRYYDNQAEVDKELMDLMELILKGVKPQTLKQVAKQLMIDGDIKA